METIQLVARVVLGAYFVLSGAMHFMKLDMMSQYAASKKLPAPQLGVLLSGAVMVLGGLVIVFPSSVAHEYWDYALWSLAGFLVLAAILFHNFWSDSDPSQKMMNRVNFMKNLALASALLLLL